MNTCAAVLLLSFIAFSECFVLRSDMVFPTEDWEFQNHQTRHHRNDFYLGSPRFPVNKMLGSYPEGREHERLFDKNQDFDNHRTSWNNQNVVKTRISLRESAEESTTRSAPAKIIFDFVYPDQIKNFRKTQSEFKKPPRKYIVGDFVFPDQVKNLRNWRKFINTPSTNEENNRVRREAEKAPPTNVVGDFVFPDQRENFREKNPPKIYIVQDFVFPDQRKNFLEQKRPKTNTIEDSVFPDQRKHFRGKRSANKELSSNIIGDFVFPDQVMKYKNGGYSPPLKAVFGTERGKDQRQGNY